MPNKTALEAVEMEKIVGRKIGQQLLPLAIGLSYLPSRPNNSTPRAANMKNKRKKRRPRLPTWGKACITVSRSARIPLAIFSNLRTVINNRWHSMLDTQTDRMVMDRPGRIHLGGWSIFGLCLWWSLHTGFSLVNNSNGGCWENQNIRMHATHFKTNKYR